MGILGLGFPEEFGGITEGIDRFHGLVTGIEMANVGAGGLLASLMIHGVALPPVVAAGSAAIGPSGSPRYCRIETASGNRT